MIEFGMIKKVNDKMNQEKSEEVQVQQLRNLGIDRSGTKLIVPEGIDLDVAIRAIAMQRDDEEQIIDINHIMDCDVAEGMVAFLRVLQNTFGFVSNKGQKARSFFDKDQNPSYIGIETAPGKIESIPNGNLQIPGITGFLRPTFKIKEFRPVFAIVGEVKGKESSSLEDHFPKFSQIEKINSEDLILNIDTKEEIDVSLFTPIIFTQRCRENNIPLKRGILLEGPYGTGKSLTASATANLCMQNGWTFIYLKDVTKLSRAYAFAEKYQPAVIFSEDIDQVLKNSKNRDATINNILNEIDGIDTKGMEIITVLTTNHVNNITTAMLRPGRLDTVVSVRPPDIETIITLIKKYAGDILEENAKLDKSASLLQGEVPALIREVVERSKLSAIRREGNLCLKGEDIELIANSMKNHMQLLKPQEEDKRSDIEKAADSISQSLRAKTFTLADLAVKHINGVSDSNGVNDSNENHQAQSV